MSLFNKQEFVSPEPVYAQVKEELSSYFDTGVLDDLLFDTWTNEALSKIEKSRYPIRTAILTVCDSVAQLPEDFNAAREVWACEVHYSNPYTLPTYTYFLSDYTIEELCEDNCTKKQVCVNKVYKDIKFQFSKICLLSPGNIETHKKCGEEFLNPFGSTRHSFDIQGDRMILEFQEGHIYFVYYAEPSLEGDILIPDNPKVKIYLKEYLIYSLFRKLSNTITDESFNQVQMKKQEAYQLQLEAYTIAITDLKKRTLSYLGNNRLKVHSYIC